MQSRDAEKITFEIFAALAMTLFRVFMFRCGRLWSRWLVVIIGGGGISATPPPAKGKNLLKVGR